jgi:hypothetical protein
MLVPAAVLVWVIPAAALAKGKSKRWSATFYIDLRSNVHVRSAAEALERAFSDVAEINFTPIRHIIQPVSNQVEMLSAAQKDVTAGREQMKNLEVDQGLASLQRAVALQEKGFHLLAVSEGGVTEHATLLAELAMAHFLAGDESGGRGALQRALVLMPTLEYDGTKFPPQMRRMFDEVRFLMDELGAGDVRIATKPVGSLVHCNGKFVGFGPVTARGLTSGVNLVSVSKTGFVTRSVPIMVEGGEKEDKLTVRLKSVKGRPSRLLKAAQREAIARVPQSALPKLAKRLRRRILFFATATGDAEKITVSLSAYDSKRSRVSSASQSTISASDPDAGSRELVASLIPFLRERVPKPVPKGPGWFTRFRRSPYFWPVIGATLGAAVVGASVGLGVHYGTKEKRDYAREVLILPAAGPTF